ncbi:MAG: hypothetical protein ACI959_000960 [Limisphaerales bacterium]|jgi:hypothetical protein
MPIKMMKKLLACAFALCILMIGTETSAQTILLEDFEGGGFPSGWTQTTFASDGGWIIGTDLSSAYWPLPAHTTYIATNDDACNCDKSADRLISPAMDLTAYSGSGVFVEFVTSYDMITYGGATEEVKIQVSTDGVTFTDVATVTGTGTGDWAWRNVVADLSAYAGMPLVHVAFLYNDNGGWEYGAAIDDVKVFVPLALDAEAVSVDFNYSYYEAGPVPISGTIRNAGSTSITTMDINYTVDGGATVTENRTGLSIAAFTEFAFEHATPWSAAAGTTPKNIEIWASNLNGGADMDLTNDRTDDDVYIVASTTPRHVVSEHFTSTNCPPCGAANPAYQAVLDDNSGDVTNLEYHVWWPVSTDPFYIFYSEAADIRVPYYDVSGVPNVVIDGGAQFFPGTSVEPEIVSRAGFSSIYSIDATAELDMTTLELTVDGTVTSLADYWNSDLTVHTVVVEEFIGGPNPDPNPNTEFEFHNTVRAMLPGTGGANLTAISASATQDISYSYTIDDNEMNPVEMFVTIFVQEESTKEVMQGFTIHPTLVNIPNGIEDNVVDFISIYPNPSSTFATLTFDNATATDLQIAVYDVTGQLISNVANGTYSGSNSLVINTTDFANGMYYVALSSEDGRQMQQFQVIH